jgi:hypothetical protein
MHILQNITTTIKECCYIPFQYLLFDCTDFVLVKFISRSLPQNFSSMKCLVISDLKKILSTQFIIYLQNEFHIHRYEQ